MKQQPKRTWHIAQVNGAWRVYDPEQRQHGGRFNTAEAAQRYMEHEIAWLKSRPAVPNGTSRSTIVVEINRSSAIDHAVLCAIVDDPVPPRAPTKAKTLPIGAVAGP